MKKLVFIMALFALCLHFNQARAQRYLPGMKGLQVTAGMADGAFQPGTGAKIPAGHEGLAGYGGHGGRDSLEQ